MSPFTFVVNIMVPASPPLHLVAAWAMDSSTARSSSFAMSEVDSMFGSTGHGPPRPLSLSVPVSPCVVSSFGTVTE